MNCEIARALLDVELENLHKLPYAELCKLVSKTSITKSQGPDGKQYQIERQAFWDTKEGGNIRVMVSADDGGLSAFNPITADFIISPDGSFIGEDH
jgi:hypothetical protein